MIRGGCLLALCLLAAAPAEAATHLIAVGNNQGRADEPGLRFAERDAQELVNVLRKLGRVAPENATLLLGERADDLRRILLSTNVRLRGSPTQEEGDALVVYYSGHADAAGLHLGRTVLPYEELKALVEGSPARVRLLIIDSCQSGGITQIKGARPSEPFAIRIDQRLEAEGLAIITSSAGAEDSQESESLRASFFTHHFLTALRGAADLDGDGRVTLNEAYGYAYRGTLRSSGRTTRLQHPTYAYELKGKGDFPLTFPGHATGQLGQLQISEPGTYLVVEGGENGSAVAEMIVEGDGTRILLAPGPYFVRRRSDASYREYAFRLDAGTKVDLTAVDYDEVTYARLLRKGGGARSSIHALTLMGGVGSSVSSGYSLTKQLAIGYGLELPWLTVSAEARLGFSGSGSAMIDANQRDVALRLRAERFVDLELASFAIGLLVEGASFRQTFSSAGDAPSRSAWAIGFGGLVAVERELFPELALRLEGGVVTHVLPAAVVNDGAVEGSRTQTPLTWWFGLGARWSL